MLAIPMSALKRYKWVIAAIAVVAFILGSLWHVQEVFRQIINIDIIEYAVIGDTGKWRTITFVYIMGAVLSVPIIYNGEKIVDCMGHSNIFILAFMSFALRFCGLYYDNKSSWMSLLEVLEPLSFYLPWLTMILFTRHLIPKKFLALGQGLVVILFFSLGRALGFFYGINRESETLDLSAIYAVCATFACVAAYVYFFVYHLILAPRFRVPNNRLAANNDSSVSPQRVFHDERSRKGYFRY
jgi:MFS_1 like family